MRFLKCVTCSRKSFRSHQDSQGCTIIGGKKIPNEEREMPNGTSHSYMSMPLELECSNALKDVIEGNLTENGIPNNATVEELFSSQVKTDTRKIEYDTTFKPPYVLNILDNKKGQRIIQVAMALPSGVQHSDVMVSVDNDYEHLNVTIPMDPNLADGWTVNGDLVFNAKSLSPEQRSENFFFIPGIPSSNICALQRAGCQDLGHLSNFQKSYVPKTGFA